MVERKCSLWILVLAVANVWAANVWDGSVATSFAAGEGTAASPYQISNGAELALFAQKVSAGEAALCGELTNDIYLNENSENYAEWGEKPPVNHWSTPIGLYQQRYQGVFDGKGHKVYGAYLDTALVTGYDGIGFFGTIGASATVKNLSVEQSYFAVQGEIGANAHAAVFAGIVAGGKLENVSANGFVYSNVNNTTTTAKYSEIGCLVGYAAGTSAVHSVVKNAIANCKIVAAIEKGSTGGNYHSVGGLIAKLGELIRVENVYSRSSVKHASKTAVVSLSLGGIVGYMGKDTDTLYNAYYNISEVGETNAPQTAVGSTGGVRSNVLGKLTVNMKSEDFANVLGTSFTYTAKQNDGYPQLVVFEGASAFEGGDGSEDKPFLIGSAKALRAVSGLVNGMNDVYASKSYRMIADVALNEGDDVSAMTYLWEPVGVSDKITFEGRFDGAGKSIYGLIVPEKYIYAGLFGVIGANGIVENLSIRDSKINGIAVAGAFAGWNIGLIRYCSNYSLVDSYSTTRSVYAAGIVAGIRQGGRVEYCSNYGKIHADAAGATLHGYAGGIASENIGLISRSINEGEIACDAYAGGIASYNYLGTIENCINTGKVDSQNKALAAKYNDSNMAKYSSAGGICAINKANSTVLNSYSISNAVIGSKIAQIVAENSGTIDNCYFASGKVSGANVYSANSGTVTNSAAELVGRMKTGAFALVLGDAYKQDDAVNDGFPTFLAEGETFGPENLFEGGDGSEGKPFLIATATQLRNMEYLVNKKNKEYGASHYKLIADISLNENSENYINWHKAAPANTWTPMGADASVSFKGVFDGGDFSISGVYTNAKFSGLFGVVDADAVVKNLTIKESFVKTTAAGGMVGSVAAYNKGRIHNVHNGGNVVTNMTTAGSFVIAGGVVGFNEEGVVDSSSNTGTLDVLGNCKGNRVLVGGVVGKDLSGTLEYLTNDGLVQGHSQSNNNDLGAVFTGGVVGLAAHTMISHSVNNGQVTAKANDSGVKARAWARIGGIVGIDSIASSIKWCVNTGDLSAVVSSLYDADISVINGGGIVGDQLTGPSYIGYCRNEGNVTANASYANARSEIGGILGWNRSDIVIEYCYTKGIVSATSKATSSPKQVMNHAGGIVGCLTATSIIRGSFSAANVKSTVSPSGTNRIGGIVANNVGTIIGSYFDKTVAGTANIADQNTGTLTKTLALTTEEMQTNEFAWKLNTLGGDAENAGVFTRYNDYPVFADESYLPIYRVVFDDEVKIYNHYTSHKGYVDAPAEPEPAPGELFVGWTDGDKYMLQNRQVINKDMTLYALFTLVTEPVYSITFIDGSDVYVKATENTGIIKTLPTAKNIPMGYHFDGWFDNVTNKEVTTETIFSGKATVVAKYSANLYKITFLDYDGSEISSLDEPYGKMPTVPKAPVRESVDGTGYKFIGWDSEVAIVTGEASYKAVYESYEIVSSSSAESSSSSSVKSSSSSSEAKSSSSSVESSSSETVVSSSSSSRKEESSSSSAKSSSSSATSSSSSVVSSSSSEKSSSSFSEAKSSSSSSTAKSSSSSVKSSSSSSKAKSSSSSVKSSSSSSKAKSSSSSVKSSSSSSKAKSSSSSVKSSSSSSKAKSSSSSNKAKSSSSKSKNALPVIAQMSQLKITTVDRDVQISGAREGVAYAVLDLQGRVVMQGSANAANFNLTMPRAGRYLVCVGIRQKLVAVK